MWQTADGPRQAETAQGRLAVAVRSRSRSSCAPSTCSPCTAHRTNSSSRLSTASPRLDPGLGGCQLGSRHPLVHPRGKGRSDGLPIIPNPYIGEFELRRDRTSLADRVMAYPVMVMALKRPWPGQRPSPMPGRAASTTPTHGTGVARNVRAHVQEQTPDSASARPPWANEVEGAEPETTREGLSS